MIGVDGDARRGMEGHASNLGVTCNYDNLDLESGSTTAAESTAVGEEVNLEDEPVAKILLPSLKQKKPTTIKINLQNTVFHKKNIISNIKLKPTEEVVVDPKQVSIQSIPIPVIGAKPPPAKPIPPAPKFNIKTIDRAAELRSLYRQTINFENNKYAALFVQERQRYGTRIACRACTVLCTSETDLICHAHGKRHLARIAEIEEEELQTRNTDTMAEEKVKEKPTEDIKLAPGEPVPPGFEDEMKRVPMCQVMLNEFHDSPLIGLEYLVELMAEDDASGRLVCFLCDKKGENPLQNIRQNIISHLIGTSHRVNYLKKHFPSVNAAIQKVLNDRERKMEAGRLVRTVAANIEADFGRLHPGAVEKHSYEARRDALKLQIENEKHFSETPEKTYVELVIPPPQEKTPKSSFLSFLDKSEDRLERIKDEKTLEKEKKIVEADSVGILSLEERAKEQSENSCCASPISDDTDIMELAPTKKKPRLDDPLKDTTPISVSSGSLSRSHSSPSRSRSRSRSRTKTRSRSRTRTRSRTPSYQSRRYTNNPRFQRSVYGNTVNRYNNPDRSERNERYARIYDVRQRSRSPRFKRSRSKSPPFQTSRSPVRHRHHFSRSPTRSTRHGSMDNVNLRGSQSPPRKHSNSPSVSRAGSRTSIEARGAPWVSSSSRSSYRSGRGTRHDKSPEVNKPLNTREKWDQFREEADAIEIEMEKVRQHHQKNPEKHPLYNEEWKKFWNARYKELQSAGKDPAKHDFKSEWIPFWNQKMEELHTSDFKAKKDALKKKLELTEGDDPVAKRWTVRPTPDDTKYNYPARDRDYGSNRPGGSVSDVKDTWKALTGAEIHHIQPYTGPPRSPTWDPPPRTYNKPQRVNRDDRENQPYQKEDREESYKVVAVLRLLTALENQLGSFGPKVNTLLSKAISMEKREAGSSEELARDVDNVVLFETVKEKFRGQLMAGIVEKCNISAVRLAIADLTKLLARAPPPIKEEVKPATITAADQGLPKQPVTVPGVGMVDKAAIAVQIAEALLAQGRTDVSEEELQQLIDAVIGMAKQSAETNEPVSTANFVKKLQGDEVKEEEDKKNFKKTVIVSEHEVDAVQPQPQTSSNALKALQAAYNKSPPPHEQIKKESQVEKYIPRANFKLNNVAEIGDLAEADLKSCLRIFQHLSTNEQRSLVMYLKKIEDSNPERVEKLRKYVNLGAGDVKDDDSDEAPPVKRWPFLSGPTSPFASREGASNPSVDDRHHGDDSDDDYSFDDVYKAAARNVDARQKASEEAERIKKQEEQAKIRKLSKPADNNAIKRAIDTATDDMIANLRESVSRKPSPRSQQKLLEISKEFNLDSSSQQDKILPIPSTSQQSNNGPNVAPVYPSEQIRQQAPFVAGSVRPPLPNEVLSRQIPVAVTSDLNQGPMGFGSVPVQTGPDINVPSHQTLGSNIGNNMGSMIPSFVQNQSGPGLNQQIAGGLHRQQEPMGYPPMEQGMRQMGSGGDMGFNSMQGQGPNFMGMHTGGPGGYPPNDQYPVQQHFGSNFGSEPFYQYNQQQDMYTQQQQYLAQQQQQQQLQPPGVGGFNQPEANAYHPAQYSASYEKRQQKKMRGKQPRQW